MMSTLLFCTLSTVQDPVYPVLLFQANSILGRNLGYVLGQSLFRPRHPYLKKIIPSTSNKLVNQIIEQARDYGCLTERSDCAS